MSKIIRKNDIFILPLIWIAMRSESADIASCKFVIDFWGLCICRQSLPTGLDIFRIQCILINNRSTYSLSTDKEEDSDGFMVVRLNKPQSVVCKKYASHRTKWSREVEYYVKRLNNSISPHAYLIQFCQATSPLLRLSGVCLTTCYLYK